MAVAIFLNAGMALWAAIDSTRIQLKRYKSGISYGPVVLFFACAMLWIVGFPWYLAVRHKIKTGSAILKDMTTESKPAVAGVPVFGIVSVTAPFIGMALIYVLLAWLGTTEFGFYSALLLIPLSPLTGIAFALGARKRREPYWALPWIGLVINITIICFLIANANRAIHNLNWGG